jgi:hypothetical protein
LRFLCAFAFLNPLVTQAGIFLAGRGGASGFSIPQLFQGGIFLLAVACVVLVPWRRNVRTARLGRFLLLLAGGCTVILFKTACDHRGAITLDQMRDDLIFFFKIFFWAFMWWFTAVVVRQKTESLRVLRALLWGATGASLIVVASYLSGAGTVEAYERSGIIASVGASGVSPKQTVAYLAPCALIAMYLGRKQQRLIALAIAVLLIASTLVTYDRSIQVGLLMATGWLVVWWGILSGRREHRNWSVGLLAVACTAAVFLFASAGFESLQTRWTEDFRNGRPGSGRLEFYQAAWERFSDGSLSDMLAGIGYSGIKDTMHARCGLPIHTHSDLFDLLLGGGLLGLLIYLTLLWNLLQYWRGVPRASAESALMGAYLGIFAVMSLITGQLEATHAMFALGATLHCCHVLRAGRTMPDRAAPLDRSGLRAS